MHSRPTWTEERVDLLRRLWAEGFSASQIAGQLGGVTRNAVVGKVHRLGLSGRATKSRKKPRRAAKRVLKVGRVVINAFNPRTPDFVPPREAIPMKPPKTEPVPADAIPFLKIKDGQCRHPYGDPKHKDFGFCGKRADGTYCKKHRAINFIREGGRP